MRNRILINLGGSHSDHSVKNGLERNKAGGWKNSQGVNPKPRWEITVAAL